MAEVELDSVAAVSPAEGRSQAAVAGGARFSSLDAVSVATIVPEWRALSRSAADDNLFFHPDFALPAIEHLDPGIRVATVRNAAGRLIAAAPFAVARLGHIAPAARLWSHDYGPLGVPLVDDGELDRGVAALVGGIAARRSLVAPDLPLDMAVAKAIIRHAEATGRPVTVVEAHERAIVGSRVSPGGIRAALPARRRKEYARQLRRLGELGPVVHETATEPDHVRARFEEFLALEGRGWKGRKGTSLASTVATAALGREVVFNLSEEGQVAIDSLRLGDRAIAMVVCFICGETAYTWKIAYDESHARFSPGAELMLDLPDRLFAGSDVRRIDSCAVPNHPMIDHLWRDRLRIGTVVIGPPGGGAVHRIGLAAFTAEIRARAEARHLKARLAARRNDKETGQ